MTEAEGNSVRTPMPASSPYATYFCTSLFLVLFPRAFPLLCGVDASLCASAGSGWVPSYLVPCVHHGVVVNNFIPEECRFHFGEAKILPGGFKPLLFTERHGLGLIEPRV